MRFRTLLFPCYSVHIFQTSIDTNKQKSRNNDKKWLLNSHVEAILHLLMKLRQNLVMKNKTWICLREYHEIKIWTCCVFASPKKAQDMLFNFFSCLKFGMSHVFCKIPFLEIKHLQPWLEYLWKQYLNQSLKYY